GETGVRLRNGRPVGLVGRARFDSVQGNFQRPFEADGLVGLSFETTRTAPEGSPLASVLGRYLLAVDTSDGVDPGWADTWDASLRNHRVLRRFALTGQLEPWQSRRAVERPAGAVSAHCEI